MDRFRRWGEARARAYEAEELARWAAIDPERRLRVVKPFGPSLHHGIDKAAFQRFLEIKRTTLGYVECTIREWDEDRCRLSRGCHGYVASREDADRLLAALACEYPGVPFRVELVQELLDNVVWRSVDDVLMDTEDAEPGAAADGGA